MPHCPPLTPHHVIGMKGLGRTHAHTHTGCRALCAEFKIVLDWETTKVHCGLGQRILEDTLQIV